jgi:hypothetical protein
MLKILCQIEINKKNKKKECWKITKTSTLSNLTQTYENTTIFSET